MVEKIQPSHHTDEFLKQAIVGEDLLDLAEEHLPKLGMEKMGERMSFLRKEEAHGLGKDSRTQGGDRRFFPSGPRRCPNIAMIK